LKSEKLKSGTSKSGTGTSPEICSRTARKADLPLPSVEAAVSLFDEGCTIPFVARYRKDMTGALSDEDLRRLWGCLEDVRALEERRAAIRSALEKSGKLTDTLREKLQGLETRQQLEDFYEPFKERRRTKATVARERGLEGLARLIRDPGERRPAAVLASSFLNPGKGVASVEDALSGAVDIIVDEISVDPEVRGVIRERRSRGQVAVKVARGKKEEAEKSVYRDLLDLRAPVTSIKPHRVLALNRAEREGFLSVSVEGDASWEERQISRRHLPGPGRPADQLMRQAITRALQDRVGPACENDVRRHLTELAQERAIETFRENLRQLLLAPPLKRKAILGVDPGFTSGCKCAAVDAHGNYLSSVTIFPQKSPQKARELLLEMVERHGLEVIAIGNGTASRETSRFVREALKSLGGKKAVSQVIVSEAGASVYSASALAAREHPDLDVTVRGALSIARRVQDPLAELVKIDPWHLGVGQYQHDVDERKLRKALDGVVEQAVNQVGVDLNRASVSLLERVSGISPRQARAIVERREKMGPFKNRAELLKVQGIGKKVYQQAAGFLRIPESTEPLDRTAVHPESYKIARKIAKSLKRSIEELLGETELLSGLDPARFAGGIQGVETVADILRELAQPGRDPRGEARSFEYTEGVEQISELKPGMVLTGTVTNLTDFGAFVDLGVHRDGLLHISRLGRRVDHPAEVVRLGQQVRVRVESVDLERERIALALEG